MYSRDSLKVYIPPRKKNQEPSDDEVVEIDKHNEDLEAKYVSIIRPLANIVFLSSYGILER